MRGGDSSGRERWVRSHYCASPGRASYDTPEHIRHATKRPLNISGLECFNSNAQNGPSSRHKARWLAGALQVEPGGEYQAMRPNAARSLTGGKEY